MHVDQGLRRRMLNDILRRLDDEQLAFINDYMNSSWKSIGQPRPRTCPAGGLMALRVWITCSEYVGLARAIVTPLAAVLPAKAAALSGDSMSTNNSYAAWPTWPASVQHAAVMELLCGRKGDIDSRLS